jgi:hypothetical protein
LTISSLISFAQTEKLSGKILNEKNEALPGVTIIAAGAGSTPCGCGWQFLFESFLKAHQQLDKSVDLCYRPQPFPNETKRIEFYLSSMTSTRRVCL